MPTNTVATKRYRNFQYVIEYGDFDPSNLVENVSNRTVSITHDNLKWKTLSSFTQRSTVNFNSDPVSHPSRQLDVYFISNGADIKLAVVSSMAIGGSRWSLHLVDDRIFDTLSGAEEAFKNELDKMASTTGSLILSREDKEAVRELFRQYDERGK